jgi:uncharacterized sodium:solute symporter family permease YidK
VIGLSSEEGSLFLQMVTVAPAEPLGLYTFFLQILFSAEVAVFISVKVAPLSYNADRYGYSICKGNYMDARILANARPLEYFLAVCLVYCIEILTPRHLWCPGGLYSLTDEGPDGMQHIPAIPNAQIPDYCVWGVGNRFPDRF